MFTLPPLLADWLASRRWALFPHQQAMLEAPRDEDILLLAPTGSGKTLAGFLPGIADLLSPASPSSSPPSSSSSGGLWPSGDLPAGACRGRSPNARGASEDDGGGKRGKKARPSELHTLYLSPLKALANDIHRNLTRPLAEMNAPIRVETRTGDTAQKDRARQKKNPPHFLLTTPESLALLLTYPDASELFKNLKTIILDEIHTLVASKRGDQTALLLARLAMLAPDARRIGLSATVRDAGAVAAWLGRLKTPSPLAGEGWGGGRRGFSQSSTPPPPNLPPQGGEELWSPATIIRAIDKKPPEMTVIYPEKPLSLAGHYGEAALPAVYDAIKRHRSSIVFVNTRAQAELAFQKLWALNADGLGIALHHGSLTRDRRQKVEQAMAEGKVRAVVATSSLDLGLDWGDVDLVIQLGAPKGLSRLRQRIGRSNHRMEATSKAMLAPTNRFEALECEAAADALIDGQLDDLPPHTHGGLDVLAQHVFSCASAGGFRSGDLLREIRGAYPYRHTRRAQWDEVVEYVRDGGYVLKRYEQFARLVENEEGKLVPASKQAIQRHRMNIGTIVESEMLRVVRIAGRAGGKRKRVNGVPLGQVEERLVTGMKPGDTFLFAGQVLEFRQVREMTVEVAPASSPDPKVPAYNGGKMPLSTHLAARVRRLLRDHARRETLPLYIREWLELQEARSALPPEEGLLVECFERAGANYIVAYPFEGRAAHQTLGFLVTRRMEQAKLGPLGFTVSDYGLCVWCVVAPGEAWLEEVFAPALALEPLEDWLNESALLKRVFRNNAVIAGLTPRKMPGRQNSGKQVTFSTDLIYDVLTRYEPDHLLLRASRLDATREMADLPRLQAFLARVEGKIDVRLLDHVTPFAIPVMTEITTEGVGGASAEAALAARTREEYAEDLWREVVEGE